jgi:hypothetical protein
MRKLQDNEIDVLVLMVSTVAQQMQLDDADFIDEFAQVVRKTKSLPVPDAKGRQSSESAFIDTHVLTGIGLGLVALVGTKLVDFLLEKAFEHGFRSVGAFLQKRRDEHQEDDSSAKSEDTIEAIATSLVKEAHLKEMEPALPTNNVDQEEVQRMAHLLAHYLVSNPQVSDRLIVHRNSRR